jgi:hypothetical protein
VPKTERRGREGKREGGLGERERDRESQDTFANIIFLEQLASVWRVRETESCNGLS